jgi:SAM-dependent methyltransferase
VFTCGRCGLGFSDDEVTQDQLDAYYAELAKYGDLSLYSKPDTSAGSLDAEAPWELERARDLAAFTRVICDREQALLDVGCSTGTFLALLRDQGFSNLRGCDPLASAVAIARDLRNLRVEQGWIGSLDGGRRFDVIVLSHVLEHILELRLGIQQVLSVLGDEGRVIIEVPDASRFDKFIHAPYQDFNTEHVNHFSPASLANLMESNGFRQERCEQVLIRSGPEHPYPALRSSWVADPSVSYEPPVSATITAHHGALVRYSVQSESLFSSIDEHLLDALGAEVFALWGAGQLAMKLLARPRFPLRQLSHIVDAAPTRCGYELAGHVIVSPDELAPSSWPRFVVAGSIFAETSIQAAVEARGIPAEVVALV